MSSIHGLVYLGERKRHIIERIWWAIAIVLSISLCTFWVQNIWQTGDPIILRIRKEPKPIYRIPFPAVSICPVTKAAAKKFNYTDVYRALLKFDGDESRTVSPEELETMKVVNQLCKREKSRKAITDLYPDLYTNSTIFEVIQRIAPDFNETFIFCKHFDKWVDCNQILFPFLTDEGFCYAFNTISLSELLADDILSRIPKEKTLKRLSDWSVDNGYDPNLRTQEPYPYRVYDAGRQHGLTIILRVDNNDLNYMCGGAVQGFKIGFHSPIDIPRDTSKFYELSPKRAAVYSIEPRLIETAAEVHKYQPHERQCFFNTERKLRYYKQYTEFNCKKECLSNYTMARCGCVNFSLPRPKDIKICGPAKSNCTRTCRRIFHQHEITKCNCLSSCSALSYHASVTTTHYDYGRTLSKSRFQNEFDLENSSFSRIIVSFKNEVFTPLKRVENYSWADILSSIGGICGLFMGASLLSIIELLYYLTLRIFFAYRSVRQTNAQPPKRILRVLPIVTEKLKPEIMHVQQLE